MSDQNFIVRCAPNGRHYFAWVEGVMWDPAARKQAENLMMLDFVPGGNLKETLEKVLKEEGRYEVEVVEVVGDLMHEPKPSPLSSLRFINLPPPVPRKNKLLIPLKNRRGR